MPQVYPHQKDYPNCKVCGNKVNYQDAEKCVNCWEVENRIDKYLESPIARNLIKAKLRKLGVI